RLDVAVSAGRRAGLGLAAAAAGRLLGAGPGAAGAVAVEETVRPGAAARQLGRVGAAVAGLARAHHAVAADRDGALSGGRLVVVRRAAGAGLRLTGRRAAVAVVGVAVVAGLAPRDHVVAAERDAGASRHRAAPAALDVRAVVRAAVVVARVAVIAGFGR